MPYTNSANLDKGVEKFVKNPDLFISSYVS
jgi:hypothetical protein